MTTARRPLMLLARLLLATAAALLILTAAPAHAQDFYIQAPVSGATTCFWDTHHVATSAYAPTQSGYRSQWVRWRVHARDVTGSVGPWSATAWRTSKVTTGPSEAQYLGQTRFVGREGHAYQTWVQVEFWNGYRWQGGVGTFSHHYNELGGPITNAYGAAIHGNRGAAQPWCRA